MFAKHPDIAKRWEEELHQRIGKLPDHAPMKKRKKKKSKGY